MAGAPTLQSRDDDSQAEAQPSLVSTLKLVRPRICHVPEYDRSLGQEVIELGRSVGLIADAHQEFVIEHGCGVKKDGSWAAFEVGLCEPRQNGKGGILELRELAGMFLFPEKLLVHSAHEFRTSTEHFLRLQDLIEEADLQKKLKRIVRGHGEEGFELKDGTRMHFRTRTKKGGRGFSADFLALDEAMIISEAMHGALLPTLRARSNPQVWLAGSAVDQEIHEYGIVFSRVRERALEGRDQSLAYFEWSVDLSDPEALTPEMAMDEELWAQSNPALDVRISREHMRKEREALDLRTFAVELLGIGDWPRTDGTRLSPILPAEWDALIDILSVLRDPIVLAYDVSPERRCSVAAAGKNQNDQWHVEIVAQWPGTKWLPSKLAEFVDEHEPLAVVCDGYGPAASMVGKVMQAGVEVDTKTSEEHARACGQIVDAVSQQTLRHLGSKELENAVRGAAIRPLGDRWAWNRKSSAVDISPLVAATLALSSAMELVEEDDSGVMIW